MESTLDAAPHPLGLPQRHEHVPLSDAIVVLDRAVAVYDYQGVRESIYAAAANIVRTRSRARFYYVPAPKAYADPERALSLRLMIDGSYCITLAFWLDVAGPASAALDALRALSPPGSGDETALSAGCLRAMPIQGASWAPELLDGSHPLSTLDVGFDSANHVVPSDLASKLTVYLFLTARDLVTAEAAIRSLRTHRAPVKFHLAAASVPSERLVDERGIGPRDLGLAHLLTCTDAWAAAEAEANTDTCLVDYAPFCVPFYRMAAVTTIASAQRRMREAFPDAPAVLATASEICALADAAATQGARRYLAFLGATVAIGSVNTSASTVVSRASAPAAALPSTNITTIAAAAADTHDNSDRVTQRGNRTSHKGATIFCSGDVCALAARRLCESATRITLWTVPATPGSVASQCASAVLYRGVDVSPTAIARDLALIVRRRPGTPHYVVDVKAARDSPLWPIVWCGSGAFLAALSPPHGMAIDGSGLTRKAISLVVRDVFGIVIEWRGDTPMPVRFDLFAFSRAKLLGLHYAPADYSPVVDARRASPIFHHCGYVCLAPRAFVSPHHHRPTPHARADTNVAPQRRCHHQDAQRSHDGARSPPPPPHLLAANCARMPHTKLQIQPTANQLVSEDTAPTTSHKSQLALPPPAGRPQVRPSPLPALVLPSCASLFAIAAESMRVTVSRDEPSSSPLLPQPAMPSAARLHWPALTWDLPSNCVSSSRSPKRPRVHMSGAAEKGTTFVSTDTPAVHDIGDRLAPHTRTCLPQDNRVDSSNGYSGGNPIDDRQPCVSMHAISPGELLRTTLRKRKAFKEHTTDATTRQSTESRDHNIHAALLLGLSRKDPCAAAAYGDL